MGWVQNKCLRRVLSTLWLYFSVFIESDFIFKKMTGIVYVSFFPMYVSIAFLQEYFYYATPLDSTSSRSVLKRNSEAVAPSSKTWNKCGESSTWAVFRAENRFLPLSKLYLHCLSVAYIMNQNYVATFCFVAGF